MDVARSMLWAPDKSTPSERSMNAPISKFTFSFRMGVLLLHKKQSTSAEVTFSMFPHSWLHNAASKTTGGLRDFARVINRIFLSLNLIGSEQKKRNDVTEIVSQLEIADAIFFGG